MPRDDAFGYFGVVDLEKKRLLRGFGFPLLRNFVTRTTNLHELADLNFDLALEKT